jgi:hypothetical protein
VKQIVNFIGFQAAWFAAVIGAAGGRYWPGPAACLFWLAVHVLITGHIKREILVAVMAFLLGMLIESLMAGTGVYTPQGVSAGRILPPLWMLALWINFGTLVNGSLSWLKGRYWFGAFLGALGGPAAYYSGHRLGALTFHPPLIPHLVVLGFAWAVALPLLFFLAEAIERKTDF